MPKKDRTISIKTINLSFALIVILFSVGIIIINHLVEKKYIGAVTSQQVLVACNNAASTLQKDSDNLTLCINNFVDTHEAASMTEYFEIIDKHLREQDLQKAKKYNVNCSSLEEALSLSNELAEIELHAFALVTSAFDTKDTAPQQVAEYSLSKEELELSKSEKILAAQHMIHGREYNNYKHHIYRKISNFESSVLAGTETNLATDLNDISIYLKHLHLIVICANLFVILMALILYWKVTTVLSKYIKSISQNEFIDPRGTIELKYLANVFNKYLAMKNAMEYELQKKADIDPLTQVANRRSFETFIETKLHTEGSYGAFVFLDIDDFKNINDTYGHDTGDLILKKLAAKMQHKFRENDFFGRFGGDEFVIWLDRVTEAETVMIKQRVCELSGPFIVSEGRDIPVSISAGIAFCKSGDNYKTVSKHADMALYEKKRSGKHGCIIYEDKK